MKRSVLLAVFIAVCAGISWADIIMEPNMPRSERLKECQKLGFETPRNHRVWQNYFQCDEFSAEELSANLTREQRLLICARLSEEPADRVENSWYNCSEFSKDELEAAKQTLAGRQGIKRAFSNNLEKIRNRPPHRKPEHKPGQISGYKPTLRHGSENGQRPALKDNATPKDEPVAKPTDEQPSEKAQPSTN